MAVSMVSSNRWTLKEFISFSRTKLKLVIEHKQNIGKKKKDPTILIKNKIVWYNPPDNDISTIRYRDLCDIERGIPPRFFAIMHLPFADVNPETGVDGIYELILTLPGGMLESFDVRVKTQDPKTNGKCKLRPVDLFDFVYRAYKSNPQLWQYNNTTYFDQFASNGPGRLRLILSEA